MSRIRGRDTKPEKVVRSLLYRLGYRFRLQARKLPGRPDIVLPRYRTVVFVHGCFWHRHRGCKNCTTPSSRRAFWVKKLEGNAERDRVNRLALKRLGWRVVVVWECETESRRGISGLEKRLAAGEFAAPVGPADIRPSIGRALHVKSPHGIGQS
jgi:DNA mismatch endonuclease (patch repair protein)